MGLGKISVLIYRIFIVGLLYVNDVLSTGYEFALRPSLTLAYDCHYLHRSPRRNPAVYTYSFAFRRHVRNNRFPLLRKLLEQSCQ